MEDYPQNTTSTPSQPSPPFPESLVRAIVRDELFRQKLADENEALRVRVAELEASAAKSIPVPAPAPFPGPAAASVSTKREGEGKGLAGDLPENMPKQEPVAVSLPGADASGKSAPKTGGKIKWI